MATVYVIAGPNGAGKSSTFNQYVPVEVPFINTDEISKKIKEEHPYLPNTQEQANDQALRLVNSFITKGASYGIESNLYDQATWDFIAAHRNRGYRIEMKFYTVSDVSILHDRVRKRVEEGGHFVRPDVIDGRYRDGLHFLKKNFHVPDKLYLVDCSQPEHRLVVEMANGQIIQAALVIPEYLKDLVLLFQKPSDREERPSFETVDDIRKRYKKGGSKDQNPGKDLA